MKGKEKIRVNPRLNGRAGVQSVANFSGNPKIFVKATKIICEIFRNSKKLLSFVLLNISYIKYKVMKKIFFTAAIMCFAAFTTLTAQDDKGYKGAKGDKDKKETQEIIIRKKGQKDAKISVEINGDKVTINGKPLSEFKDDEITINKRNIIIRDGKGGTRFQMNPEDFEGFSFNSNDDGEPDAFLGVTTNVYSDNDDKDGTHKGAEVTNITKGSAAEKAGLKNGDVITKINDKKVDDPNSLSEVVTSFKPKDEVTVYYKRDGKEQSAKATLGERKESKAMSYSFSGPDGMARSFSMPRIQVEPGVDLGDMSPRVWSPDNNFKMLENYFPRQQKLGVKIQDTEEGSGVKVLDIDKDSPAEKAGLKKDDVVTEIAGKKITNTDEMREQLMENMEKSAYNIKATRNGSAMSFDIKIPKKLKTANL
jgi:serine protease Do